MVGALLAQCLLLPVVGLLHALEGGQVLSVLTDSEAVRTLSMAWIKQS